MVLSMVIPNAIFLVDRGPSLRGNVRFVTTLAVSVLGWSPLPSLPCRAISKGLACAGWPPRDVLEQGTRFTLPDASGTGRHLTPWRPWEQGPHRMHLAVHGCIRLQHGD